MSEIMRDVPIRNKRALELLDKWLEFRKYTDILTLADDIPNEEAEYYVSDEYFNKICEMKMGHDGFPEKMKAYNFQHSQTDVDWSAPDVTRKHKEMCDLYNKLLREMTLEYAWRNTALASIYPPGGMISWHNNANAPGYNVIFSWSETGDSYFKYWDPVQEKEVIMYDKPGWNAKVGGFGSYSDGWDKVIYHAAHTNCWRMTLSFVFKTSATSTVFQDMLVEDLMYED